MNKWAVMAVLMSGACVGGGDNTDKDPIDDGAVDTDDGADTADTDPVDTDPVETVNPCPVGTAEPKASTSSGCVTGFVDEAVESFLGVPYTEPPLGALRWKRPVPVAPWTDPRESIEFGSPCLQFHDLLLGEDPGGEPEEDCLTLNVMRPTGTVAGDDLPILFFTHGGGYVSGSSSQVVYADTPDLATRAIVVTHNYRLGPMGFLAHRELGSEDPDGSSGNQGLFDTLLALQWVRDNAEAFGGDVDRVQIFGESAGALTTCALLASPLAADMFSSALIESGPCGWLERPLDYTTFSYPEAAVDQGARLTEALGCTDAADVLQCMRAAPAQDIIEALPARLGYLDQGDDFFPVVDGVFLPEPARDLFGRGDFNRVPIIAGINEDEGTLFTLAVPVPTPELLEAELRLVGLLFGLDRNGLVDLYPANDFDTPKDAFDAFYGDAVFVCPTRSFLNAVAPFTETRAYHFSRSAWFLDYLGAYHAHELGYVFGSLAVLYGAEDQALSQAMQRSWVSAANQAPSVEGEPWPLFGDGVDGGHWAGFGVPLQTVEIGVHDAYCDWFDAEDWQAY